MTFLICLVLRIIVCQTTTPKFLSDIMFQNLCSFLEWNDCIKFFFAYNFTLFNSECLTNARLINSYPSDLLNESTNKNYYFTVKLENLNKINKIHLRRCSSIKGRFSRLRQMNFFSLFLVSNKKYTKLRFQ